MDRPPLDDMMTVNVNNSSHSFGNVNGADYRLRVNPKLSAKLQDDVVGQKTGLPLGTGELPLINTRVHRLVRNSYSGLEL